MSSKTSIQERFHLAYRPSVWAIMLIGLLTLGSGCTSNSSTEVDQYSKETQSGDRQIVIVRDFADRVVIPTYQLLVKKADELSTTVDVFVSNPNNDTLKAAQDAWIAARFPWEQSEAFAFGPADSLGYDGDLDDWPVNETDLDAVLKRKDELTPEYVKDLTKSWVEGVEGKSPYREVLATAGDSSNPAYPTVQAAVEEIVQGMLGCLDEVANEKIGEPLETKESDFLLQVALKLSV